MELDVWGLATYQPLQHAEKNVDLFLGCDSWNYLYAS